MRRRTWTNSMSCSIYWVWYVLQYWVQYVPSKAAGVAAIGIAVVFPSAMVLHIWTVTYVSFK